MRSAKNPTPTWVVRFVSNWTDVTSEETAYLSSLPRQSEQKPISLLELPPTALLPEIPQESPVLPATIAVSSCSQCYQYSGCHSHSTSFKAEWKFYSKNSVRTTPSIQNERTKGNSTPETYITEVDILRVSDILISEREMLLIWVRMSHYRDKIELNSLFHLRPFK